MKLQSTLRVDLHIHTTASDGRWTPQQVVDGAREAGIGLFAVADHDAVDNVIPTETLMRQSGLAFLRAVEISTTDDGAMYHILGYGINPTHPPLLTALAENTARLRATDDDDIRQLIALGYPLDYDDYLAYTYDRTRGGFKSYNYLLDQGLCADPYDFFQNIRAQIGYQWPTFIHPAEAMTLIRDAGGLPVLAHPKASLPDDAAAIERILNQFLSYGLAGIECYSQYHDAATTAYYVNVCDEHRLIITGGSDYHGGFVGRKLGVPNVTLSQLRLKELEQRIIQ